MPDFQYVALDRAGKRVTGTLQGRDSADAAARVRSLGYFPVEIASPNGSARPSGRSVAGIGSGLTRPILQPSTETGAPAKAPVTGKRVPRLQILLFTRELADLIDAGLPIDRALSVLIEQTDNELLRAMVGAIRAEVRAGNALSDSLKKYPREFPDLFVNMIHAGEVSGQLASVLTRLADFMEKEQVRKSQVIAALTYPMVLIGVATVAVTFLLVFVIPRLQDVFRDLGADLPAPTRLLLGISGVVMSKWWMILLGIAGAVILFRAWIGTGPGRRSFDAFRLSVPLFGVLTQKIVMSRFARTLGTLLAGGVPILESLSISAEAVGNVVTSGSVRSARDAVRQGETLSSSLEKTGSFLPLIVHMSAVGEETGRLPAMLVRTADTLDFEVDNTLRRLTSLVEPFVVLAMGTFVGFVVLSVLLPIFEASTAVK